MVLLNGHPNIRSCKGTFQYIGPTDETPRSTGFKPSQSQGASSVGRVYGMVIS